MGRHKHGRRYMFLGPASRVTEAGLFATPRALRARGRPISTPRGRRHADD
jgi:hypothetical protein